MSKVGSIIAEALSRGRSSFLEKIAEETGKCKDCGQAIPADSELCSECAARAANRDKAGMEDRSDAGGATSPETDEVRKLASAANYIFNHPELVNWGEVRTSLNKLAAGETIPTDEKQPIAEGTINLVGATTVPTALKPLSDNGIGASGTALPNTGDTKGADPSSAIDRVKTAARRYFPKIGEFSEGAGSLPENRPQQTLTPEAQAQARAIDSASSMGLTPRKADEVPKKELSELFDEPAKSAKSDPVLQQAFTPSALSDAGVKIASQKLIQKLAFESCICGHTGSCAACRVTGTRSGR